MKFAKSLLMGTGGVALAGLLLSLLAPKAAHGLVAALVQVANTSSAPAIASLIDDPGRVAFMATQLATCSGAECVFIFSAVPATHRLVIQHVSLNLLLNSVPNLFIQAQVYNSLTAANIGSFNVPPMGQNPYLDQPFLFYFDAGQVPTVDFVSFSANFSPGAGQTLTLVGYELDCAAAPCAPIANH